MGFKAFRLALMLGVLLCPVPAAQAQSGPEGMSYWASDQAGFRGASLGGPADSEWVLGLGAGFQAGQGTRILYHEGKEAEKTIARLEKGLREELLYRPEGLVSIQRLDPQGALVEEELYDPPFPGSPAPILRSSTRWTYVEGRLAKAEAFDGAGTATGSLDYTYDASGRLLQVLATGSLGSGAAGLLVSPQGLGASWSDTELTRYDSAGRPQEILAYAAGKVIASSRLAYAPSGSLASRTTEDLVSGGTRLAEYDSAGHVVLELESRGGKELSRRSLAWDSQGRPTRDHRKAGDRTTETLWVYGEEGELSRATYKIDGLIVSVVHELPGDRLVKEVYDGGVLALRATSLRGRLVQEDFFAPGAAVRTKVYP